MQFQSEAEVAHLARQFEDCEVPDSGFHHAQHVAILAWYLLTEDDEAAACDRFRRNLVRFAESLGAADKYHETVTVLWFKVVAAFLADVSGDRLSQVNAAAARFADKSFIEATTLNHNTVTVS